MKIAILVAGFLKFEGPSRIIECQSKEFIKKGHHITIFTFEADINLTNAEIIVIRPLKNLLFKRIYRLIFLIDIFRIIKCIKKLKGYDLIICHHPSPICWLAYITKRLCGVKYISYNHHIDDPELFPKLHERLYVKLYFFLIKTILMNADTIISVSEFSQKQLKEKYCLDSEIVYNGIDCDRFHKGINGLEIRKRYNLNDDPIILYVGRIVPYKGVHLLINAFKLVKQEVPNAKLVIIGEHRIDRYSNELKEMSDDTIIFIGYISDEELNCFYGASTVYATASLLEGFDLPLVEAQACGKPVVAFDIGSHREIVNQNNTGLLVPPRDLGALADAIIKLLRCEDLTRKMGENGRKLVEENFTCERSAEMIEKFMRN